MICGAILAAAALYHSVASAENTSPAYNFLNVPSSTHAFGLGGINISTVADDIMMIDQNPALLGPEMEMQVGMNYTRWLGNSNFAGVKFGMPVNDKSAWAVGLQYLDYGKIDGYDEFGHATGQFSPKDMAVSAFYSHDIYGNWRGGATLKFLYSAYSDYTALALATDLGVNYYDPDRDLSLSLTVMNLGGQVKRFADAYDRLPIDVRFGWTQSFGTFPVRFNVTLWNLTKWHLPYYDSGDGTEMKPGEWKDSFGSNLFRHIIFGLDFVPSDRFYVALGYNYKTRTDMSTYHRSFLSGWNLAAGLNVKNFGIGIGFGQPHSGGTTLMLNLSTNLYEFRH